MKQGYKQKCEYCDYEWVGKLPNPCSCPRCKRRRDVVTQSVPGRASALRFIEANLIRAGTHPSMAHTEAKRKLNQIIGFERSK